MFMWLKLSAAVCFAFLVQTTAKLDHFKKDDGSVDDTCAASTSEQPTSSLLSPQPPKCQCDCNKGDCASLQQSLTQCGYVVFYGEQKDMKFCRDDEFYQARCMDQIDCAESIQCFVTCCLQGKGAYYIKRLLRGPQFEVLDLCHPNADPKFEKDFKDQTECNNAIWADIYRCVRDYNWKTLAAIKKDGIDIPRFCCTFAELINCYSAVSQVQGCNAKQQLYFNNRAKKYVGYATSLLCGDKVYNLDSPPCNCLPPVDRTGPPLPSALQIHIHIARVLMNSSNEECQS